MDLCAVLTRNVFASIRSRAPAGQQLLQVTGNYSHGRDWSGLFADKYRSSVVKVITHTYLHGCLRVAWSISVGAIIGALMAALRICSKYEEEL